MESVNALVINGTCWKSQHTYRSILDGQIELVIEIKAPLLAIRQASLTFNPNLACVIILGLIQAASPDLLGDRASYRPKDQVPLFQLQLHADFFLSSWSGVQEKEQKMSKRHQRIGKSHVKKHSLDLFTQFAKRISILLLFWILIRLELFLSFEQMMLNMR